MMTFREVTYTLPGGQEVDVHFEMGGEEDVIDVIADTDDVTRVAFLKRFTWHAGRNPIYMHANDPAAVWSVLRDVVIDLDRDACELCGEAGHEASQHEGEGDALSEYNAAHADFKGYAREEG